MPHDAFVTSTGGIIFNFTNDAYDDVKSYHDAKAMLDEYEAKARAAYAAAKAVSA
jgi:hypothetical protein